MVDKATGDGTSSGRPMNATRLRQAGRRMFDPIDPELADRHEAILLGREHRNAAAMTYLMLSDNADGTFSGKFTIPELHGHLFKQASASPHRTTSPVARQAGRTDRGPHLDTSNLAELWGGAFCELLEHLPLTGTPRMACRFSSRCTGPAP